MSKLLDDLDGNTQDPLIPCKDPPHALAHSSLEADLAALEGMSTAGAAAVAQDLHAFSVKTAESVKKIECDLTSEANKKKVPERNIIISKIDEDVRKYNPNSHAVEKSSTSPLYALQCGDSHKEFKINEPTLLRLKAEFCGEKEEFVASLFSLLVRYEALEGYGYQAALTRDVFKCLSERWGVTTECFASPLNHCLDAYHSAYLDTDEPFGSLGSFFDPAFRPKSGSFEANPPFTEVMMLESLVKMHACLRQATGPLSFAVVVPAWTDEESWQALCASPFLSTPDGKPVVIEACDHCYLDGALSKRNHRIARPAPWASGVFFLQNKAGAEKWPVTDEGVAALRVAFRAETPDEDLKNRMEREGLYRPKRQR